MTLATMSRSRSLDDNNDVADRRAVCGCPRMVEGRGCREARRGGQSLIPCETCRVIFKSASSDSLTNRNFRMLRPETGRNLKVKRYKHVHLAPSTTLPPLSHFFSLSHTPFQSPSASFLLLYPLNFLLPRRKLMLRDFETQIAVIKII